MFVFSFPGGGGLVSSAAAEAEVTIISSSSAQVPGRLRLRQSYVAGFSVSRVVVYSSMGSGHRAGEVSSGSEF
ncbi:hypothetical protein YC2023_080639 [Brassica napus]